MIAVALADRPRSAVPALTLIRGDEPLLVSRAILSVVSAATRKSPATEVRRVVGSELTVPGFLDLVAASLFAEPRAVVISQSQDVVKDVASAIRSYLADPVDDVTIVIHHSGGKRNKALVDEVARMGARLVQCAKITKPAERIAFVKKEISAAGGTASASAVTALVDAVGHDLTELASAAAQLVTDTGGTIDEAAVRRYHRGRAEVSGFTVADLAVAGDTPGALEALRWALAIGVADVVIADALADGVRMIGKVASARGANTYQLASQWGMPPWKIDKVRGPARHWSAAGVAAAMEAVSVLNAQVKGFSADQHYALERAVAAVGAARAIA